MGAETVKGNPKAGDVQDIADEFGGQSFEWATTPEDRTRLWTARHNAYFAGVQSVPGCRAITTDTCVPISRLAEIIEAFGGGFQLGGGNEGALGAKHQIERAFDDCGPCLGAEKKAAGKEFAEDRAQDEFVFGDGIGNSLNCFGIGLGEYKGF